MSKSAKAILFFSDDSALKVIFGGFSFGDTFSEWVRH